MTLSPKMWQLNGRPVRIADFRVEVPPPAPVLESGDAHNLAVDGSAPSTRLRECFPEAGESFEGGLSDGYRFILDFRSSNPDRCLSMIKVFLAEHGFGELPLPKDYAELKLFRLPRKERRQLHLFADDGYVHNPIKILFPPPKSDWRGLRLEIYNEQADRHLVRFHDRG
ncbi:MAG: hypothetical protein AAFY36_08820 [Bacteroidota bacterium]